MLLLRTVWGGYRRLSQKFLYGQEPENPHRHEGWIRGIGFALLFTFNNPFLTALQAATH